MPDNLSTEQRRKCMAANRSVDTSPEVAVRSALHRRGLRFRKHVSTLPGRPDVVFVSAKVAVFVDGDFWHGYRLPAWEKTLAPAWRKKIRHTRRRDQKNFRRLRSRGWKVVRVWEHQVKRDLEAVICRVEESVRRRDK